MFQNNQINRIDKQILDCLQADGRMSNVDLAQKVGLSPAACLRRVRQLEEGGVIRGYTVLLDAKTMGTSLIVYAEIALQSESAKVLEEFERAIQAVPEVRECHLMSGESDYLLKLALRDLEDYERVHRRVLANLPHVAKIKSSFSLRTVVQRWG
jgi:Lrp/AsnC family leucine-responsive transcriptional regulator